MVVRRVCDFDNFPDDLTPRWRKEAGSHIDRTSKAKLWLARMKRGCAHLIVTDTTLAIIVIKNHSQMYQYDTHNPYKILNLGQDFIQNKGLASNSYCRYDSPQTSLRVF